MQEGRMTVQLYERDPKTYQSAEIGNPINCVLAVTISYGQTVIQISLDEERESWEIEVVGRSTVYHS